MTQGLPVSRLINVTINLSPTAAQGFDFSQNLVVGQSNVINVSERLRAYGGISEVTSDFGTDTPEFLAAELFFSQVPQPKQLLIGRWAEANTNGLLVGGILTSAQQAIALWNIIADAEFHITVDGNAPVNIGPVNLTGAANLNGVATLITTALGVAVAGATCAWNGSQFTFTSASAGGGSSLGYLTGPNAGTNISAMLRGTAATGADLVQGINAESALDAVTILDDLRQQWYGLQFAAVNFDENDALDIAAYIEAGDSGKPHLFGYTSTNTDVLDPTNFNDIFSLLKSAGYRRTMPLYSENAYAATSFFGRALTVNFNAQNTTLTMMYKVLPGVVPQSLTSTQANTLQSKRGNVFVTYENNTAIIQYGTMAGDVFFDEMQNTDWLRNRIQTDAFNLLYTSQTKIPQTDAGNGQFVTVFNKACAAAVNNGMVAPGVWNQAGFGQLNQGDYLPKGYYVYAPPVASQDQADREARKSVPFQIAIKLAGAIHTVDVLINVNR